jgi:hypothetical protein
MKTFREETMTGLMVLGSHDITAITLMLTGHYDRQLCCVAYDTINKKEAECEEDISSPEVLASVERLKNYFRRMIQNAVAEEIKMDEQEKKEANIKRMYDLHSKSELGTVAEICAKYGFSKGEVRKMRAEGTLSSTLIARDAMC